MVYGHGCTAVWNVNPYPVVNAVTPARRIVVAFKRVRIFAFCVQYSRLHVARDAENCDPPAIRIGVYGHGSVADLETDTTSNGKPVVHRDRRSKVFSVDGRGASARTKTIYKWTDAVFPAGHPPRSRENSPGAEPRAEFAVGRK